jgi:hypothetical protein
MALARNNGTLLRVDGLLAKNCCCDDDGPRCVTICCDTWDLFTTIDCTRPGVYVHTITIPDGYVLPVPINITGDVDDDLLLNGASITTDLGLDPGPYPSIIPGCVGAHQIGEQPGPFADPINGGITFPMEQQVFVVSLRDTIGGRAGINVTICVDPNKTQRYRGNLQLQGSCDPGLECNPLP